MKKYIILLLVFVIGFMCVPVLAVSHNTGDVIPVGESATISTDLFQYEEMVYTASVPGKNYGKFTFKSIKNVSSSSIPISINILLFDSKKENIGFVTYCSDQDYGGDYSQKKLKSGDSIGFSINVTNKYFVEGKGPEDVIYYAVYDENSYCHVGGYTKYEGLTMEEILQGENKTESDPSILVNNQWTGKIGLLSFALVCGLFLVIIILVLKTVLTKSKKIKVNRDLKEDQKVVTQYSDGTEDVESVPEPEEPVSEEESIKKALYNSEEEAFDSTDLPDTNVSYSEHNSLDDLYNQEENEYPEEDYQVTTNTTTEKKEETLDENLGTSESTEEGESELMNLFK